MLAILGECPAIKLEYCLMLLCREDPNQLLVKFLIGGCTVTRLCQRMNPRGRGC